MATTKGQDQDDLMRQLNEIWANAKVQFDELRDAVIRSSQIAKTKLDSTFLRRERDRLVLTLGEECLKLINAKEIDAPAALKTPLEAIREVDRKIADEQLEIDAILKEGEEAAKESQSKRKKKGK